MVFVIQKLYTKRSQWITSKYASTYIFQLLEQHKVGFSTLVLHSVTWLGDLLHLGQLFKACGNNYFAQIADILRQLLNVSKSFIFVVKSFLGNFHRHLATLYWSHWSSQTWRFTEKMPSTILMIVGSESVWTRAAFYRSIRRTWSGGSATRWLDYFFNIWPFTIAKICPMALLNF